MYVFLVSSALTTRYKIKMLCSYLKKKKETGSLKKIQIESWETIYFSHRMYISEKKHVRKQGNLVPH